MSVFIEAAEALSCSLPPYCQTISSVLTGPVAMGWGWWQCYGKQEAAPWSCRGCCQEANCPHQGRGCQLPHCTDWQVVQICVKMEKSKHNLEIFSDLTFKFFNPASRPLCYLKLFQSKPTKSFYVNSIHRCILKCSSIIQGVPKNSYKGPLKITLR